MYNKKLSKLLFEDQTVTVSDSKEKDSSNTGQEKEQRLQIRSAIPDEKMMSDNTVSHADLMTKVGPKICEMFIKSKEVAECIDVWTQVAVEAEKEENKKLSTDELVAKMNKKGQSLYKKYREIAENNPLGCIDKNIMKSLFVKNTSLGQFGKVHLNYFQAKSGTDQVEGATATDLPIYTELQVIPFFLSDDSSETFTSESKGKKNLIMGFKGAEGAFIKKENHKFYNTLMISDPSKKIVSEEQVFFGQQTIPFIYVEPDELPKIQANPREMIPKLFGLASSRKGNTTNLEREQEQAALQSASDTQQSSSQSDSEVTGESTWIYKRGLSMLLNETTGGGNTTYVVRTNSDPFSSQSDLSNEKKSFIKANCGRVVDFVNDISIAKGNQDLTKNKEKTQKIANYSALALGTAGLFSLGLFTTLGIGVYTASDYFINKYYGKKEEEYASRIKSESVDGKNNFADRLISVIEDGIQEQEKTALRNSDNIRKGAVIEHPVDRDDIERICASNISNFNDLNPEEQESVLEKVNSILITFNIVIEGVQSKSIRQAFTQDFVDRIIQAREDAKNQGDQQARAAELRAKEAEANARIAKAEALRKKLADQASGLSPNQSLSSAEEKVIQAFAMEFAKQAAKGQNLDDPSGKLESVLKTISDIRKKHTTTKQTSSYKRLGSLIKESSGDDRLYSSIKKMSDQIENDNVYNFLQVIRILNKSDDKKVLTDLFGFLTEDPNNLDRVLEKFVSDKNYSFKKAIKNLGDVDDITRLIKKNKDMFIMPKKEKGLKNKKEDKSLKSESFDVRDEWLKIWNVKNRRRK